MRPGYQLVKEQLFFRKELIERVQWFIRLRWTAVGAALLASGLAFVFELNVPVFPIILLILSIASYNTVFLFVWKHLKIAKPQDTGLFTLFTHIQITLDILALFLGIYLTGGIYSPVLIFVIFHIILAGILLSAVSCFIYGTLMLVAAAGLLFLQQAGMVPPSPIPLNGILFRIFHHSFFLPVHYITFAAAVLISAFLITSLKSSLRKKARQLLGISKELDISNAKLGALYEMVKQMGLCFDFQNLMDSATRNAAKIMGVKGCSIKLLDDQRKMLRFSSTYGLSDNYTAKGSINLEKSPINRKIVEGDWYTIGKIDKDDYFQFPEDIRKEGIASMVCLPLRMGKTVLGIFCVYSDVVHYFEPEDVKFFNLMAELTAIAMENLKTELNKAWFLKKAAHQLRSPLNAIYSMLEMIRKGYQGPIHPDQLETLTRCSKRLTILGELINDLLKLGLERTEEQRTRFHLVDVRSVLESVRQLHEGQASQKGINMVFRMDDDIPQIMADEKLLDDLFTNLLSNALKYTPPGGHVEVALAKEPENCIRFEVSDSGIGIPEEDFCRLFTEFFRAENAKAFAEEGTGLGLVIIKESLDLLRGAISVESKVGEGTRFKGMLKG